MIKIYQELIVLIIPHKETYQNRQYRPSILIPYYY